VQIAKLTFEQVQAQLEAGAVGLLPVGATEAHGPHLPLETDVVIASETCRRAGELIRHRLGLFGLILPPVAYSITDYAAPFAGTVSVPKEVVVPYLSSILIAASGSGFRALCLVNGHLEPAHRYALRDAAERAREEAHCPVALADPCDRRWVPRLTEEFQRGACHAGQYETSLLLAAGSRVGPHAELPEVEIDLMGQMKAGARDFAAMGARRAYFGRPSAATAEEGHASFDILADIVCTVVTEAVGLTATESSEP